MRKSYLVSKTNLLYSDLKLGNIISVNGHNYIIIHAYRQGNAALQLTLMCNECGKISNYGTIYKSAKTIYNDILDFETSSDKKKVFCDYHIKKSIRSSRYIWKSRKFELFYYTKRNQNTLCEEWKNNKKSFEDFMISNNYADGVSARRINPNKPFGPNNIVFVKK